MSISSRTQPILSCEYENTITTVKRQFKTGGAELYAANIKMIVLLRVDYVPDKTAITKIQFNKDCSGYLQAAGLRT